MRSSDDLWYKHRCPHIKIAVYSFITQTCFVTSEISPMKEKELKLHIMMAAAYENDDGEMATYRCRR